MKITNGREPICIVFGEDKKANFNKNLIPSKEFMLSAKKLLDTSLKLSEEKIKRINEAQQSRLQEEWANYVTTLEKPKYEIVRAGFVYIYRQDKYYKIGRSKKKDCRITKYITENPKEIELIFRIESADYVKTEKHLHKIFEKKRIRKTGEWFLLTKEDINKIKKIYANSNN